MDTNTETHNEINVLDGDHDKFAHYADATEVTRAYIEGSHVTALCGKTWIPFDNPEKFPVCPTCEDIYRALFLRGGRDMCGND